MKTSRKSTRLMPIFGLFVFVLSCNMAKTPKMVTMPFTAQALGEYVYFGPDTLPNPKCTGDLGDWRVVVEARGNGEPVGDFTIHFDFCGNNDGHYGNLESWLIAGNGDTLFLDGYGQVLDGRLEDHPEYVISYWRDTILITGGTGIYEGASGLLTGDDYNSSEDSYSHHNWTGTLTMMEQKKD